MAHYKTKAYQDDAPSRDESASLVSQEMFVPAPAYNDKAFLVLFFLHLCLTAGIIVAGIVQRSQHAVSQEGGTIILAGDVTRNEVLRIAGVLGIAAGVAFAISVLWSLFMRRFPRQIIYFSILANILLWVGISIALFATQQYIPAAIMLAVAVLMALLMTCWRSRIPFAQEMLRVVAEIASEFPATLALAYGSLAVIIVWYFVWLAALALAQQFSPTLAYCLTAYLLFSLYWVTQVLQNILHVSVSGLYASVYFLRGKGLPFPEHPTLDSLRRAGTTSLGSICLGSMLVALLQTLRSLIQLARGHRVLRMFADCILSILENLMMYFNKWAFVQVAIYGRTYCQAAYATWELMASSGLQAVVNDNILSFVLNMGCFFGAAGAGLTAGVAGYFVIAKYWVLCAVLGGVLGWLAAAMVAMVIESGIATEFVCFASEPAVLRANNPALYQRLVSTYNLAW